MSIATLPHEILLDVLNGLIKNTSTKPNTLNSIFTELIANTVGTDYVY